MSDETVSKCAELQTRVAELERKLLDVTSERDQKVKRLVTWLEARDHDLDRAKSAIAELTNEYTRVTKERDEAVAMLTTCRRLVWYRLDLVARIDAVTGGEHATDKIHQVRDRE